MRAMKDILVTNELIMMLKKNYVSQYGVLKTCGIIYLENVWNIEYKSLYL